jgi:acyl carrier protein
MDDVKSAIRDFIVSTHLPGESPENLRDNTPLITSGILDSMAVLGLVSFLEQQFNIELDIYDTSIERFDSLEGITRSVVMKQNARSHSGGVSVP